MLFRCAWRPCPGQVLFQCVWRPYSEKSALLVCMKVLPEKSALPVREGPRRVCSKGRVCHTPDHQGWADITTENFQRLRLLLWLFDISVWQEFPDFTSWVMNCKRWSFQITSRILKEVLFYKRFLVWPNIAKHRSKGNSSVTINVHRRCHLVILVMFAISNEEWFTHWNCRGYTTTEFTQTKFVNWLKQNHLPGLN